jgi:hypothetical protein
MKQILLFFIFLPLFAYSQTNKTFTLETAYKAVDDGVAGRENFTITFNGEYITFYDKDYNTKSTFEFPLEFSNYGYRKDGLFYENYNIKDAARISDPWSVGRNLRSYFVFYDKKGGSIFFVAENRKMRDGIIKQTYYFTNDYYEKYIKE